MSTTCHDYTHPSPPIPPFIASTKPKQIASTDNMLSKLHDGYTHHQWSRVCLTCKRGCHIVYSRLYITFKQSIPWGLYWFPTSFITLILSLCLSSLSLPPLPPSLSLSLPLPSPTRYSDHEHPQKQLTLWAISWSIPPPLASTLWRRVPTRSLVSFDNLGHGCPMAKSSLHCSTLPNKVGVVGKS